MKPNAIVCAVTAVILMTACDASAPTDTKSIVVPTGIHPAPEAIMYVTNTRDVAWDAVHINPCTGEQVTVTATSHWVIMTGFDSKGGFHYTANIVAKGTGFGTVDPNRVYKINEQFRYVEQDPANVLGFVIYQDGSLLINGPGTADDFYERVRFKTVVDSNGNPTASLETTSASCTP